jgi:hypothetical protein
VKTALALLALHASVSCARDLQSCATAYGCTGVQDAGTLFDHHVGSDGTRSSDARVATHHDASLPDVAAPEVGTADASHSRLDASTRDSGVPDAHVAVDARPDARPPSPNDGSTLDAPPPHCNPNGTFGPPLSAGAAFTPSSQYDDEGMTLTWDGLTAYFGSTRPESLGDYDLFVATRTTLADPFDVALPLPGPVNTTRRERQPSISPDGRLLFYSDDSDIYVAGRGRVEVPFGAGAPVEEVNTSGGEREPFIASDGKSLYFSSDRDPPSKIYVSKMDDAGRFGAAKLVLDAPYAGAAVLSRDQLTIYVQSNGTVWRVKRSSTDDVFDFARANAIDSFLQARWPEALSPDECTLYFVALGGRRSIAMATRSR